MATELDVANLALAHIGDAANLSSLTEQSVQAEHCARFLPIARDEMLESFAWKFAKRRAAPALRAETNTAWQYAYQEPADCLRVLALLPSGYTSDDQTSEQFDMEIADDGSPLIVTNTASAVLIYTARVTDPSRFSPLFTSALSWLLAAYIAGPIIKGDAGASSAKEAYAAYTRLMMSAAVSSANQFHKPVVERTAPWMAYRSGRVPYDQTWRDLDPVRS